MITVRKSGFKASKKLIIRNTKVAKFLFKECGKPPLTSRLFLGSNSARRTNKHSKGVGQHISYLIKLSWFRQRSRMLWINAT